MSVSIDTVGIIANPSSGKDIRRLVAFATTVDNQGKVNILRRALVGLGRAGIKRVVYMPDSHQMVQRASEGLGHIRIPLPSLEPLDMPVTSRSEDSALAANLLRGMGVGCMIVLGGDGTVRAVSKGCGKVPLLAVSTGTNNVLPEFVEGTIAGLASGYIATGQVPLAEGARRHKWLEFRRNGSEADRALVDIAVLHGQFTGARAIWDVSDMLQVLVTRADPANIGISAIAAMVHQLATDDPRALVLEIDPTAETSVMAAFGPGLIGRVGIAGARWLREGEAIRLPERRPLMLALDGEREQVLRAGDEGEFVLHTDGPWLVDASRTMRYAAAQLALCLPGFD